MNKILKRFIYLLFIILKFNPTKRSLDIFHFTVFIILRDLKTNMGAAVTSVRQPDEDEDTVEEGWVVAKKPLSLTYIFSSSVFFPSPPPIKRLRLSQAVPFRAITAVRSPCIKQSYSHELMAMAPPAPTPGGSAGRHVGPPWKMSPPTACGSCGRRRTILSV